MIKEHEMEHDWKLISCSFSNDYECTKCGRYTNGGPHDGGPYFPTRGSNDEHDKICLGTIEKERERYLKKINDPSFQLDLYADIVERIASNLKEYADFGWVAKPIDKRLCGTTVANWVRELERIPAMLRKLKEQPHSH